MIGKGMEAITTEVLCEMSIAEDFPEDASPVSTATFSSAVSSDFTAVNSTCSTRVPITQSDLEDPTFESGMNDIDY